MRRTSIPPFVRVGAGALMAMAAGCTARRPDTSPAPIGATTSTVSTGAVETSLTVPLTSTSSEARALYDRGVAAFDQIRFHDAHLLFAQAAERDPAFAMAHYQLALTAPTPKEFGEHLNHAVALSDRVSAGERLMILGLKAQATSEPGQALRYAEELVAKYPRDERARMLLGFAYLNQQKYDQAIGELRRAIEINPAFSTAYNSLGYAYMPVANYAEAERAFRKYIELVPREPNPYDSYAELLLKTGRFDESIEQYGKALSIDPYFGSSRIGIAANLMYQGRHDQAIAEAQKLYDAARNDGDRRTALFNQALIHVDAGNTARALQKMEELSAMSARLADTLAMYADAHTTADILLEGGRLDDATRQYERAVDLQARSGLPAELKAQARRTSFYDQARVALARGDLATAKARAADYAREAEARRDAGELRTAHRLNGSIALQEKNYQRALAELAQADQQNPYVIYLTALAARGSGDAAKAKELFSRAASMYVVPTADYVFVRARAKKMT